MNKQKKGGLPIVVVAGLLLLIIAYVAFLPIVDIIINVLRGQGDDSACTLSLFGGKGTAKCPIEDVTIFPDKVEIEDEEGDVETFLERKRVSKSIEDFPKEALARLLRDCLSRGGGHGSRAFSRDDWFGKTQVCLECASLTIDDSVGRVTGFRFYLTDNGPPGLKSDKSYMDFLTANNIHRLAYTAFGEVIGLSPSVTTFEFETGKFYTIFFLGIKKGKGSYYGNLLSSVATGDFTGFFDSGDTYFSYISESRNLGNVCERIVN